MNQELATWQTLRIEQTKILRDMLTQSGVMTSVLEQQIMTVVEAALFEGYESGKEALASAIECGHVLLNVQNNDVDT